MSQGRLSHGRVVVLQAVKGVTLLTRFVQMGIPLGHLFFRVVDTKGSAVEYASLKGFFGVRGVFNGCGVDKAVTSFFDHDHQNSRVLFEKVKQVLLSGAWRKVGDMKTC